MKKIGFGGSCHWCTEAIFRSLRGVTAVEQGWISSDGENAVPSEAVIVNFDPDTISLQTLITVHLHTHSCTSAHEMRSKYRSAVYTFDDAQAQEAVQAIQNLQKDFTDTIITRALPFQTFKLNEENYLDYYYKDPSKPFCQNIVNPKLKTLLAKFAKDIAPEHLSHLVAL
ncbi:peptide methionine sulfoxide reductase [Mucilaginibacter corticis]|uniref:peptide-methionine (S)-S-oxide reductase n=1 Tax=Mucilaginibacter corticis TaxID=2597670 RepID=A0A556MMK8_9SPHI|nr:peptide methionine sulfoxide reductase [Mucilaginibacter corticis]